MKTTLVSYTGAGNPNADAAMDLLIFTKSTRLEMSPGLLHDIEQWPRAKKLEELQYMANTIPSSWEFVDYVFMIEQVSRGFTHQYVRSRHASFAQQTMRVLNVKGWDYYTGPTIPRREASPDDVNDQEFLRACTYHDTMREIGTAYDSLIEDGAAIEDARGILPTNILTNIVAKFNLRDFVDLYRKRSSIRVQGEYREVLEAMKAAVLEVHPWVSFFIERTFDTAAQELSGLIESLGHYGIPPEMRMTMHKKLDQMKGLS